MKQRTTSCIGVLLVWAFLASGALAQGTAQISGIVTDASGARLPGVDVVATETNTGFTRRVASLQTGSYTLSNLPIGTYRLEVSLPGFQVHSETGVTLEVNANAVIDVTLEVGPVTQMVEVQADTKLTETRAAGVAQTMGSERILELPLNGRNVTQLIALSGTAVSTGVASNRSMPGQLEISVAGSQQGTLEYVLDGAPHTNWYDNLSLPLPFPDALREFKVETGSLGAEQGGRSGARVNSVTRSGENVFHGNAFWFVRNDLFGARQHGAEQPSTFKRNQYGGTIGGPIALNELFFFAGYQGTKVRQDPGTDEAFVPTEYALTTGDWSRMLDPSCSPPRTSLSPTLQDGVTPSGFVSGAQIDPALYNPVAVRLVQNWLPTELADDCGRVQYGIVQQDDDWQLIGRIDWQPTESHSVMGRFLHTTGDRVDPLALDPDNVLVTTATGWERWAGSYALGDTWEMSPATVVSTRLAVNYTNVERLGADFFDWSDLGVNGYFTYVDNYARIEVDDGFSLGGCTVAPASFKTFSASLNSDLSLLRRDHQWGFGGSILRLDSNGYANCNSAGTFDFDGSYTGWGLADMMIGESQAFTQSSPNTALSKKWVGALYIADTWRLSPNLTMTYGVRWEPDTPETITNERIVKYDSQRFLDGVRSSRFVNAPVGFYYPGDPGFQGTSGRDKKWWDFAPRLGFAWDVFGDGRTSLRASGGLASDYPNAQFHLWTSLVPPFGADVSVPGVRLDDPWASFPGGRTHPVDFTRTDVEFPQFSRLSTIGDNFTASQAQSWNLALQRQLGEEWLASATYLGNHTVHMVQGRPVNPALFFPGMADANGECRVTTSGGVVVPTGTYTLSGVRAGRPCSTNGNVNNRRILFLLDPVEGAGAAAMSNVVSEGTASYHGLLLTLHRRADRGVNINATYTWSHCTSPFHDAGFGMPGFNGDNVYPNPDNRDSTRGNCRQDRRHNFVLMSVARTPEFVNRTTRAILSNWSLSVVYRVNSGSYLSLVNQSRDLARNGVNPSNQMAQVVDDDVLSGAAGPGDQYFDLSAVATPTIGALGNAGIRNVRGPAQWDFDVSLARTFDLGETEQLQFRAEAFNVPNSFRALNPGARVGNRFFGVIQNSESPRIIQFALKFSF